jgi:hypothetical protein
MNIVEWRGKHWISDLKKLGLFGKKSLIGNLNSDQNIVRKMKGVEHFEKF